jgi:hypothetical protein
MLTLSWEKLTASSRRREGSYGIALYLLQQDANPNARNDAKRTLLYEAVAYPRVVAILFGSGSDSNIVDIEGHCNVKKLYTSFWTMKRR